MRGAVAVDMGASSARVAFGSIRAGRLEVEFGERTAHEPRLQTGHLRWDIAALIALVRRAAEAGSVRFSRASLAIDAWGVDHGFIDKSGHLIDSPVAYRDASHEVQFERLAPLREKFFEITGLQAQPFNSVYQLAARIADDPSLPEKAQYWMPIPDLIGFLLTGEANIELTQASTTGLLTTEGTWADSIFSDIGWPVPSLNPRPPGDLGGYLAEGVRLATVGSHDTASAVVGLGSLAPTDLFLNVGTWSLIGTVIDEPLISDVVREANLTNERTSDGRIRLLRNVPGFWVVNRLHQELGVTEDVSTWLAQGSRETDRTLDLFDEKLFNPESMLAECAMPELSSKGWAELSLRSLVVSICDQIPVLELATNRVFRRIRVAGGGSQSAAFCQAIADKSGLVVDAGPTEATIMGNLATQFLAQGVLRDWADVYDLLDRQSRTRYEPRNLDII